MSMRAHPCIPAYVRHVCVDLLGAAWGLEMCRITVSFTRVHLVGVWFGLLGLLGLHCSLTQVVLCWVQQVDRYFGSWLLLGLFCLPRVTP